MAQSAAVLLHCSSIDGPGPNRTMTLIFEMNLGNEFTMLIGLLGVDWRLGDVMDGIGVELEVIVYRCKELLQHRTSTHIFPYVKNLSLRKTQRMSI